MHTTIPGLDYLDNPYQSKLDVLQGKQWPNVHTAYEAYEGWNWYQMKDPYRNTEYYYQQYVINHNPDDYYQIDDPETAAKVLACISYLSSEYIRDEMNKNSNWEDDEGVQFCTKMDVEEGLKFNMGLIEYAQDSNT